ncbi:MAG: hypothetical protein JRM74_04650 [Nitrososphaerota archaeon]|nr:hypothetical protein [Nitrososphaerota archaeon]
MKVNGLPRSYRVVVVLVVIAWTFGVTGVANVHAQTSSDTKVQIGLAYAAVLGAEQDGGNVTGLVTKLNSAISLMQQANLVNSTDPARAQLLYSEASSLAQQVIQAAPAVASAGKAAVFAGQVDLAIETAVLAALALLAYVYTPRLFWRFWLRLHRDWRVKKA